MKLNYSALVVSNDSIEEYKKQHKIISLEYLDNLVVLAKFISQVDHYFK